MATKVQIILPRGALGATDSGDFLDTAMRVIAFAFYAKDDSAWDWPTKYGTNFENDIFWMCPDYQDAECDCGFSARAKAWHETHSHAADCFQEILHRKFAEYDESSGYNAADEATRAPGMMKQTVEKSGCGTMFFSEWTPAGQIAHQKWCEAHDLRHAARKRITNELYDQFKLPRRPYQWHCSCPHEKEAETYFSSNDHAERCAIAMPQFWFKPSDFRLRWYKYIGRGMEPEGELPADFMQQIFATHPTGMTIEQAIAGYEQQQDERADSFRRMFESLGIQR